jgi:hypothetical protein
VFGLISFAQGLARFAISGQQRYLPELLMSVAFLWGVVGTFIYDLVGYFPKEKWFPIPEARRDLVRSIMTSIFILVCILIVILSPFEEVFSRSGGGRFSDSHDNSVVIDIASVRVLSEGSARFIGYALSGLTVVAIGVIGFLVRDQERRVGKS